MNEPEDDEENPGSLTTSQLPLFATSQTMDSTSCGNTQQFSSAASNNLVEQELETELSKYEFSSDEEKLKYKNLFDRFALQREFDLDFVEIAHRIYFTRMYAAVSQFSSPLSGLLNIALR